MHRSMHTVGRHLSDGSARRGARRRPAPQHGAVLTESMFGADAMEAGGDVPFERMKVVQLKEELAVRGSTRTGLKMVLQRRLHAMLMQSAIEHQAREVED